MTHLGTSFSIFSQYIANGATYMVVFFMLSGFVIFLGHENSDWSNSKLLAYFYLRRLISIYPLYLFLHFCAHTRFAGQKNNLYNGKGE